MIYVIAQIQSAGKRCILARRAICVVTKIILKSVIKKTTRPKAGGYKLVI